jgi:hypothetical protein
MSTKDNLLQSGIKHLSGLLEPYLDSFEDPELKKALWESGNIQLPEGENGPAVPSETLENIESYQNAIDPDLIAFFNAVDDVRKILDSMRDVAKAHHTDGGWGAADELSRQILTELTLNYLRFRFPWAVHIMRSLGMLEEKLDDHYANRLFWHRVAAFFKDAGGYFDDTFSDLQTDEDARELANTIFFPTAAVIDFMLGKSDFIASYRWDASPDSATPRADALADRTLSVLIPMPDVGGNGEPSVEFALLVSMTFVPAEHGGAGVMMALGGEAEVDIPIKVPIENEAADEGKEDETKLNLHLELEAPSGGIVFIPLSAGTALGTLSSSASADLKAAVEPVGEFKNRILGSSKGTRLEFGKPRLSLQFRKLPDREDFLFDVRLVVQKSAFVLTPGDGDSFVKGVLPPGDARVSLDPGIGLRKGEGGDWGVYLVGGDSLEVTLPGGLKLGPAELKELKTRLVPKGGTGTQSQALTGPGGDGQATPLGETPPVGYEVEVTANFSVQIGPVTATLDEVGFRLSLDEVEEGNLGLFDLIVGYRAPDGVGIAVDGGGLEGGGYLFFDRDKEQYAGVVLLKYEKITFKAIGLLTTRLPDGSDGFSLLLMITAEGIENVPLGMGFRLTGVGGVLGIHRSMAVDVLRTGLKNKTLDSVLFPADPIRNAAKIVSDLRRVFPATRGQHLFGPVAQVSWGTDDLLTFEIGVMLEFPNPWRLVILGQMRALLPSKEKALIRINLDLFGFVDFDKREALVLATLFDSKFIAWNVTGDAAFYVRWGRDPVFILSAGGFHPSFPAPSELPAIGRLMMVLSKGDSLRMTMTWYLAVTSNSFQYGSHLSLVVKGGGFSIDGHLGYDTLVQFDPFGFIISFSVGVGLKWHGRTLASVQLDGSLSGPSPWHVKGKATFKIWIFSKSVSFDKTLGGERELPPIPVVDPKPALLTALADPANWAAALPSGNEMLVTLREVPVDESVRVHPLGDVEVRQQVLPLDVSITRFGSARVAGSQRYRIDAIALNGTAVSSRENVVDHFSPGQFQELSEGEQLSRPSFEKMTAGTRVKTDVLTYGGSTTEDAAHRRSTTLDYETAVVTEDSETGEPVTTTQPGAYQPDASTLDVQVRFGAVARAVVQRNGKARFAPSRPAHVQVRPAQYVVARRENMAAVTVDGELEGAGAWNYSEALVRLEEHVRRHPEDAREVQVVPMHEIEEPVPS